MLKTYYNSENCLSIITTKGNQGFGKMIWMLATGIMIFMLQNTQMHSVNSACGKIEVALKILASNFKSDKCGELIDPTVDSLAFLGFISFELNQYMRDIMIHRLPNKMQALAKDVPSDSEWLFGDDLNKRINNIRRTGSAITNPSYQNNNTSSRTTEVLQLVVKIKIQKPFSLPGGALLKRRVRKSRPTNSTASKKCK